MKLNLLKVGLLTFVGFYLMANQANAQSQSGCGWYCCCTVDNICKLPDGSGCCSEQEDDTGYTIVKTDFVCEVMQYGQMNCGSTRVCNSPHREKPKKAK